jgi:hypothetical protein
MINTTTGTSIENYLSWVKNELDKKEYGEVSITFVVTRGQVTDVKKISMDNEHHSLQPKSIDEIKKENLESRNKNEKRKPVSYL